MNYTNSNLSEEFAPIDGEVVTFDALGGGANVRKNHFDQDNFYSNAEGEDKYAKFEELPSWSNAEGQNDKYAKFDKLPSWEKTGAESVELTSNAEGEDEFFSEALGRRRRKRSGGVFSGTVLDKNERARRRAFREEKQMMRQDRRNLRTQSGAESRRMKAEAKIGQADAQKTAASSLGKESQSDVALANALASSSSQAPQKTGMSTGAKIGIAVGVVAVLGIVGYMIAKKK